MHRFTDIPTVQFPLNFGKYDERMNQIRAAARGFAHLGTTEGRAVDKGLMEVYAGLHKTWELIQEIERCELAH